MPFKPSSQLTMTIFDEQLSDEVNPDIYITKDEANQLFDYFKNCTIFKWNDANNDCEDRANAVSIVLDEWEVPNYKGWVFSGYIFNKEGFLKNLWRYHVAPLVPVKENDQMNFYVIDPATSKDMVTIQEWAASVTDKPNSYYLIKSSDCYIFNEKKILKDNWYKRNRQNYKWTVQGLSGINGVSTVGKAQLCFNKNRINNTEYQFKVLKRSRPSFLNQQIH